MDGELGVNRPEERSLVREMNCRAFTRDSLRGECLWDLRVT